MHGSPMLLPHSVHQHQRPFWVLSNIAEVMNMARLVELIHQYDTEVRAAALAQGNEPPPQILPMINIIAVLPAGLMPLPPSNPMEYSRRTTPPRTRACGARSRACSGTTPGSAICSRSRKRCTG